MTIKYNGEPILTDSNERAKLENELWDNYQANHQHEFAIIVKYYRLYLTEMIIDNLKRKYMSQESEEEVKKYNIAHLPDAFVYSIGKGHTQAINWLAEYQGADFNLEDFATPNYERTLIIAYQKSLSDNTVIMKNLKNDINKRYINYLDRLTENMYIPFMEVAQVLFFKGFLIAIKQLKKHYNIEDSKIMLSPLSHLPVNRTVEITPAMEGEWMIGDDNIEMWGVHWDQTYSEYNYKTGLPQVYADDTVIISLWTTTLRDVVINSQNHVGTFMMLNQKLQESKKIKYAANKDDTEILVLEYTFTEASKDEEKNPRQMKAQEREGLEQAIIARFSDKMDIPYNNTFVIYNNDEQNLE